MPVADAVGGRRQLQGRLGRRGQRTRGGTGAFLGTGEVRPRAGKPKSILGPVAERQRAAEVGARLLGGDDRRLAGRRDGENRDRGGFAVARDRRLAGPMDRPPLFAWIVRGWSLGGRFAFLFRRGDPPLDARLDDAWIAAHHQDQIFRDGERLRFGGLEVDDQGRSAGVGRRVDPRVDAARRHRGDGLVAAPVESGGEAPVHLRTGHHRRREGEHRNAEPERIRVSLGHARGGRGDADRFDLALKTRPMGRPKDLRVGIAVVVGERVGERGGGTVPRLRVAVEPRQDIARRRAAQSHERRKKYSSAKREHDDAGDADGPWRELPDTRPRGGEKQDRDGKREDKRRPDALEQKDASRRARQRREPPAVD